MRPVLPARSFGLKIKNYAKALAFNKAEQFGSALKG